MIEVTFATSPPPSYVRNGKRHHLQGPPKPWGYFKVELGKEFCYRKCPLRGIYDVLRHTNDPSLGLIEHFRLDEDEERNWQWFEEVFGKFR
jgi:hypothetical protein